MDTMKPDELREWAHAIRDVLQDFLPNRDSLPPPMPMPPNVAIVPKAGDQ
jgi:hypothetical protein